MEPPLEPSVTDVSILVAPPPRGLGLDVEDRGLSETLKRNPETLTKEAVNQLHKRRFMTAIAGKIFAVRASSLPNVVRAIARVLHLSNTHSIKLWEEFRGSGALEELTMRMGVIVGEGCYMLAGDLSQAFLPLLYVGDGLEATAGDECGIDFLGSLSLGAGKQQQQQQQVEAAAPQIDSAPLAKNKYVFSALVTAFYKIAPYHAQEDAEADAGFVKYCSDYLDVIMRVIASCGGNLRALMAGHPLQPILQQLGKLPPEACTWVSFLCTYNRCAPITELSTVVNAARLLFERAAHSRCPRDSFKVFNLVRSVRYLVTSTIQVDARFKLVWYEAGLADALLGVLGTSKGERAGVAPFSISLAVDTLLWLVRGCAKNARLVVASGGARTLEALLAKDTHFSEGVSLWSALMRELALEMTTGQAGDDHGGGVAREFSDLLGVALLDLERRFAKAVAALRGQNEYGALSGSFHNGGVVALAYVRGLTATAEVPYARGSWSPKAGQQPPPMAEGKEFHQCILLLHALASLLVPPDVLDQAHDGHPSAQATAAEGAGGFQGGMNGGNTALLQTAYDGVPFLVPLVLASIRKHRGQALRWLTLKPPVAPPVRAAFARALCVRRAFMRAGALERILCVLDQCVAQIEDGAWAAERLCTGGETAQRIAFGPFVGSDDTDSYASGGNSQVGLANDDNTALAEFLGSTLLVVAAAISRRHPPNCVEGAAGIAQVGGASLAEGMASKASERHSLALFRQLAGLMLRLLRKTFATMQQEKGVRVAQSILFFVSRFLLSTAMGGYNPLVEMVLSPRSYSGGPLPSGGASSSPPMPMAMAMMLPGMMPMGGGFGGRAGPGSGGISALLGQQEVHSPRALLLVLELLVEYPVTKPGFDFLLPVLQALADFLERLCKAQERNLELVLDAGLVRSVLWACLRPAASHRGAEAALTGLLAFAGSCRTGPEDLRLWFNAVLCGYEMQAEQGINARIEARRLSLLRVLVDVANGLRSPSPAPSVAVPTAVENGNGSGAGLRATEFLARQHGHIFGSAPIVVFDPAGGDERQGPRLAISSLHPEGFEPAPNARRSSNVIGSLVGGGMGGQDAGRTRTWPPARGYTVSVWFCVEAYDRSTPRRLPLLAMTEGGDVLMTLEINDGVPTLTTGPGKDCHAVCNRVPRLLEGEWYHLTVAHHNARNRAMQAVVYLNGSPVQTVRLAYPRAAQGLHRVQLIMGQPHAPPAGGLAAAAASGSPGVTRVKWALGPTYVLAEPLADAATLLLYALGPTSAASFVGEDGQGSFSFRYDLCDAVQLRQLIQALRAAGRERPTAYSGNAGAGPHGPATPAAGPGARALNGRGSVGGATSRGQFTDLTAAPVEALGIAADQVVLSLAPREASGVPANLEALCAYSAVCTHEAMSVELSGGALAVTRMRAADALRYSCQFPMVPVMMLCERAATVEELELALHFLLAVTRAQPWNLQAMEKGHFYAILAQLLRRKARQGLVVVRTMEPLLAMVGRVQLGAGNGAVEHQLMPVNLQALQHLAFNFGIWRHAGPDVQRLVLGALGAAVAISGSGGSEAQLAAQELNLRRFQFAGITRAVLYMLIDPDISYDLLLSMCDLVYLVLTRGAPPVEDLAAVSQLLVATASLRFQKLYVEGLIGSSDAQVQQQHLAAGAAVGTPRHHHASGPGNPQRCFRFAHDHLTVQTRVVRLKVLRRGLLRLLIKVAENYVLKAKHASKAASRPLETGSRAQHGASPFSSLGPRAGGGIGGGAVSSSGTATPDNGPLPADNEPLALFLRAVPPKLLLHITHHFGDVLFWAGTAAGKPDLTQVPFVDALSGGMASPLGERAVSPVQGDGNAAAAATTTTATQSASSACSSSSTMRTARRRISASVSTVAGGKRTCRRHQDPTAALLAYQLLVTVMPFAQKPLDRLGGLAFLQHILPSIFKSIDVQSDADAAQCSPASSSCPAPGEPAAAAAFATWERHYVWQPKALADETQDVSAFFGHPLEDAVASICSPSFQHCLRTLYKLQFAHLLGGSSLFLTLEQTFAGVSGGGARHPSGNGAKSLMPTQIIHVPGVLLPIFTTMSAAAGMSTTEGLIQTVNARPLARGDSELHRLLQKCPSAKALAASRAAAARLVAHKSLAFLHKLYLESQELREIFRGEVPNSMQSGGVSGGVASRFGRLPKSEELVEELAQVYYAGILARLAKRFSPSHAEEGELSADDGKAEASLVCQLALRFLITVAFDRLLYSSKAVNSIQGLLDVWPRDLHLFHASTRSGDDGDDNDNDDDDDAARMTDSARFAQSLQAHFRSTVLHALMDEIRANLAGGVQSPFLSTTAYKLTSNLPRFFGLVAANTFLARSWPQSHYLSPLAGSETVLQQDFWLLTSMEFLIDMLGLVVMPASSVGAAEQGAIGVTFRSAKQQQAVLAAASGGAGPKPSSSSSAASFLGGQAKQAMGGLFGISKWAGGDVDEWVTAAVDVLRKALLTGLTWLQDGLQDTTISKLFDVAIRHLGLLLPQLHSPRAADLEKQFVAALLYLLFPLLSDEKPLYREASTYVWRELLACAPQRRIMETLLSVPQVITVRNKKGEPVEKVVLLNLLNCSNGTGTPTSFTCTDGPEGFDMVLRINVHNFAFIRPLPRLSAVKGLQATATPGGDFADKEFQSWLGSLPPDIQDKIPKALAQHGRPFRDWPEVGAAQAVAAYRQSVMVTEKRRLKASHEGLKALTKAAATWRKELRARQDAELRRQLRWLQERLDRETFGARHMETIFSELIEGTSLAVAPGGVLLRGLGNVDGQLERLIHGTTLPVDDGGLLVGMQQGVGDGDLTLDSAEGPMRIRKKLLRATVKLGLGPTPSTPLISLISSGSGPGDGSAETPFVAAAPLSPRTPTRQASSSLSSAATATRQPAFPLEPGPLLTGPSPNTGYPSRPEEEKKEDEEDEDEDEDNEELLTEEEEQEEEEEPRKEGIVVGEDEWVQGVSIASPGGSTTASGVAAPSIGAEEEEEEGGGAPEEGGSSNSLRRSLAFKTKQPKEQQQRLGLNAGSSNAEASGAGAAGEGAAERAAVEVTEAAGAWEDEDEEAEGLVGADDKLKPFLVPGDDIRHRYNCARVQGVYVYPGILLFCDHHLYIIDNYELAAAKGAALGGASPYEVVEIQPEGTAILQTPSSLQIQSHGRGTPAWSTTPSLLQNNQVFISEKLRAKCTPGGRAGPSHRCHYFPFEEVSVVYRRRYHLRHLALEVFLSNGENHLITMDDPATRNELLQKLKERCNEATTLDVKASPLDEIQTFLNLANPSSLTERWVRGEISNFEYLMHLNTLSGRSYNDLTQYPVFPWVIADWESAELDLSSPAAFRDLTKPMGALSAAREMEFRERYSLLKESEQPGDPKKAFHYGTHYSTAAIVLYYLVRLQPFSEQHVRLQSGRFDHSDRLFSAMRKSWQASSGGLSSHASTAGADGGDDGLSTNTQDVRELIPEFFYLPDFLSNPNGYDLGVEADGHRIGDVGLPPWAKGSAHEFIRLHRQALESEHVSRNLHHWIDLIWGYKQRGKAAEEACNVFYYLTYEGAIDLESVEDPNLRKAYVEQIHEFGQTPAQLFRQPHPARTIPSPDAEKEATATPGGGATGGVGSIGVGTQWLRNLKVPGRATPSPPPPPATAMEYEAIGEQVQQRSSAATANARTALAPIGAVPSARADSSQALQQRAWTMEEPRRVLTSEAALRLLPPRRIADCLPSKVAQWVQAAARKTGQEDPGGPVRQAPIGQIVLGASAEKAPLALHVGCASVGPASGDAFLAWGFADHCLRLGIAAAPSVEPNGAGAAAMALPERKLTVALDAAGPLAVLAVSSNGRVLITGSSVHPIVHVWSLQKGLGRKMPFNKRQPPVVQLGTLISELHAGSITNVALSATYGIVVSVCSHNRVALLWDLNRRRLVRQLALATTRQAAADPANDLVNVSIDETTGTIVVTAGTTIHVYDANGSPLASAGGPDASTNARGIGAVASAHSALKAPATPISACCVVGDGCSPTTILTGHLDGHIRVWVLEYGQKQASRGQQNRLALTPGVTALTASPLVMSAVPDEDDEQSGEEEEEEEEEQSGEEEEEENGKAAAHDHASASKTSNCLTLVNDLSSCPASSLLQPSRAPITALTMTLDAKRLFSGDAAGIVCTWTASATGPAGGHTPVASASASGLLGTGGGVAPSR